MQNHNDLSFFQTRMTGLAQGLIDLWMAPTFSISSRCFLTSWNWFSRIHRYLCLNGTGSITFMVCLTCKVQPSSKSSNANRWWYSLSKSMAFCWSASGQLSMEVRFNLLKSWSLLSSESSGLLRGLQEYIPALLQYGARTGFPSGILGNAQVHTRMGVWAWVVSHSLPLPLLLLYPSWGLACGV